MALTALDLLRQLPWPKKDKLIRIAGELGIGSSDECLSKWGLQQLPQGAVYDLNVGPSANANTNGDASIAQAWLIRSSASQQKAWFPIMDTLRDALSDTANTQLTILWWVADFFELCSHR